MDNLKKFNKIDPELKGMLEDLINKFLNIFNVNIVSDKVNVAIENSYHKGIEKAEIQFEMNFFDNTRRLDFLKKYSFDNIKGMNEDIAEKLRKELSIGLMNLESINKLKDRVQKVMDVSVERAKMIARTESNRAENMGHVDGARQSGLKLMKRWDAHLDKRTSAVCSALDGKTIPLDQKFHYKDQEFDAPPAHPNCRSTVIFIQEDE
jgi:SPP1 gp7 family putative phage head morphogenesis protein